ncbi:MAG: hypothetical protein CMK03_12865 [Ponticaulis sp.]|nr:hypothetical protein [Ponticaulis sp.]MCP4260294.1 hypothetical protein [Planctomycetota bacterium]
MSLRSLLIAAASVISISLVTGFVCGDVKIYYTNIDNSGCCGWVDPNPLARPFTHFMVTWTEPAWQKNAAGTEMWLTSEGVVNGKVEFWTIWEQYPLTQVDDPK